MNTYHCSMLSSSQDVKIVFKKARNILKKINKKKEIINEEQKTIIEDKNNNQNKEIISLINFNMMNLAEHSSNNPLNVLLSELEYDFKEDDKKVAFVGESNLALEPSIINLGIILTIPDLEREDLKITSYAIGKSFSTHLANTYKSVYESLGDIYYDYKQYLMSQFNDGLEEFHGYRDFYHLVKNVARNLVKENTNQLTQNEKNYYIKRSIERNFAGLVFESTKETSLKRIKKITT